MTAIEDLISIEALNLIEPDYTDMPVDSNGYYYYGGKI